MIKREYNDTHSEYDIYVIFIFEAQNISGCENDKLENKVLIIS